MDRLVENIIQAANATIPKTSPNPGRRSLHWWSPHTKTAVKTRRKALRAAKRLKKIGHPDKELATEFYRSKRNECRQTIRDAKTSSWNNFVESINENQTASELWSRINALNGKRKAKGITLRLPNGITRDPVTIAEALADHFASLSAIGRYDSNFIRRNSVTASSLASIRIPEDDPPLAINAPFRIDELDLALRRSKGKSAGPDDISYPLLQRLPPHIKAAFLETLNIQWTGNFLPTTWSHSLVVPIPKQGQVALSTNNFRPISLTCCTSKVMERMVNRRLTRHLEDNNLLDHRQHAFRPGHGTGTYFTGLGQVLQDAMENDMHVDIVSLDLAKAYNRAWTPRVIHQLADWGLGGHMLHFVRNFLSGRTFQVIIGNHRSSTRAEETGVPQGSVLAVTLFLIAMNGIFEALVKDVYIYVYADDIVLLAIGRTLKKLRKKIQAAVSAATRWAARSGFALSAEKSVISHICRSRHHPLPSAVKANGTPIPFKKTIQILGVRIDRRLMFGDHFSDIKHKCLTRLNMLRTLSKPHRSTNRDILLRAAKAMVNSRIFYGIELFCMASDFLTTKLATTYNAATRIVAGLLPSTPADTACVELGTLPFRYQIAETLCCRAVSYMEKTSGNSEVFLLNEGNRALRALAHQDLPPVSRVHWVGAREWDAPTLNVDNSIGQKFQAGTNSAALHAHVTEMLVGKYRNFLHRYTDGSKASNGVGFGIADRNRKTSFRLPNACSVFSAESAAILQATTSPADKPLCILSDSASVLAALRSPTSRHPWIQDIQRSAPRGSVFVWIPGHCGIQGNDEADHLAASGRLGRLYTTEVPGQDLKKYSKHALRTAWSLEWANSRELFIRKIKGETNKWVNTPKWRDQRTLSRLRSGHTHLTHNMGGDIPFRKQCDTCDTTMTVEHIIINCPCFQGPREFHGIPGDIRNALSNDRSVEAILIAFLKDTGLYAEV